MFAEFLEAPSASQAATKMYMDQDVDTKTVIEPGRLERSSIMKARSAAKLANKLSNHLRLLATFLLLAWLSCCSSRRRLLQFAHCQKHFYHPDTRYLAAHEHLLFNQNQLLANQLLRNQRKPDSSRLAQSFQQQASDRRNSPPSTAPPTSPPPPSTPGEGGKMLVCYYTTRQSGPFLNRDAREFVIPVDSGLENLGQQQQRTTGGSGAQFAPLIPYEPYLVGSSGVPLVQAIQAQQVAQGDVGNANLAKNQQQQLIFKSLSSLGQLGVMMPTVSAQRVALDHSATSSSNSSNNNGANDAKLKQYLANQGTISQMLSMMPALDVAAQPTTGGVGGSTASKLMPIYSFVGDPETNNGLFVGQQQSRNMDPSTTPASTTGHPLASTGSARNGNNRNGRFSASKDTGVNQQLDRNAMMLMKHQQLLLAPSLDRPIALGGETDAKLLNYQQTSRPAGLPASLQQQQQRQLRLKNGNLLEQQVFAGAVSSAPPVPLSPASSLQQRQQAQLQSYSLPNANQVVFSSAGALTTKKSASNGAKPAGLPSEESGDGGGAGSPAEPAGGQAGLSSALVSSPLATMFDVFGAASQYLMRFKPSSFISPSAFAFNSIPADQQQQQQQQTQVHLQNQNGLRLKGQSHHVQNHALRLANSSLLDAIASSVSSSLPLAAAVVAPTPSASPSSSLLSLPFSPSGILASIHKSSSSAASSNDRSSSSSNGSNSLGAGLLSRFSGQNNQRREDVCGKTIHTPQRRIIGGEGARYGEFPYQVHIKIAKHQCGGALIDRQSIVTAAHCVYHFITRAPVSKLQIVIGAYDIEDEQYQELPPQYFKVNKVKLHPNFRFSASHPDRYDIAILKLDKPVKYTDNVMPVCLPSRDLKFESMVGTVTGFGKTDPSLSNRYGTRLLQKVDVPIIENNECERWHRTRGIDLKIFPEMMCAGYEDGLKDACVGDSGGPLVVKSASGPDGSFRWTLAGITSAGFGCAQSRQPGIYHRVSHTVDWILENLD